MFNDLSNNTNNDNTDNQDTLIESDILEIGPLKNSSKFWQLKDYRKYISGNDVEKLQDNLLKNIWKWKKVWLLFCEWFVIKKRLKEKK